MAGSDAQLDSAQIEENNEPIISFELSLDDIVKGQDDTFRTENLSLTDFERRNVIERRQGDVHTRVELLEVTHGLLDNGDEGTLLVFCFRFEPQNNNRRVLRAIVNVEFFALDQDNDPPVVEAIAPLGRFTVMPSTDHLSTTKGAELNLGAPAASVFTVNAVAKLEQTRTRDVSDATTVTGSINLGTGRNRGESTAAAWNLQENKHRKSGIPDSLKCAILLRRSESERFNAKVTLEADCDFLTGLRSKFKKVPLDDPILFNPRLTGQKLKRGRNHTTDDLSSVKLDELCQIRMAVEAPFAQDG